MPLRSDSSSSSAQLNPQYKKVDHRTHSSTLDRSDPAYVLSPFADPDDASQSPHTPAAAGAAAKSSTRHQTGSAGAYGREDDHEYARPVSRVFPGFPDYEATQAARARSQRHLNPDIAEGEGEDEGPPTGHTRTPSQIEHEQGQGFSYAGAGWKGGAGAGGKGYAQQRSGGVSGNGNGYGEQRQRAKPKERWWHALCAWGSDLDGGHGQDPDGQVGRTNPYE